MKAHSGPRTVVQRPRYHTPTVHLGVPSRVSIPEGYMETAMGRDTLFRRFGWLPGASTSIARSCPSRSSPAVACAGSF